MTQRNLTPSLLFLAISVLSSASCKPKGPPPVEPSDQVRYDLPSHRCAGKASTCACRDPTDANDQVEKISVPVGERRFEVKLSSVDPALAMTFSGQPYELRTNGESAQVFCWYFDLPIGSTEATLRAREFKKGEIPVHVAFAINEYRPDAEKWVPLIGLRCGSMQAGCGPDELTAEKQRAFDSRDRCARSDVKALHWNGGVVEEHYVNLDLHFTLSIDPQADKEDPKCTGEADKKTAPAEGDK